MHRQAQVFAMLADSVCAELSKFYGLRPAVPASAFLIGEEQLQAAVSKKLAVNKRGGVYLLAEGTEQYLGIYIADSIQAALVVDDPRLRLSQHNLDAFWVLAEELSHFCLLQARSESQHGGVSLLELEWQGEVDKLLLAAIFLRRQSGDAHYHHLARCLFEEAEVLVSASSHIYREASRFAARFWYDVLSYSDGIADPEGPALRNILSATFNETWAQKLARIARLGRIAA